MSLRPVFCLLVSAVLLTTAFSSESSAQWRRSGLQGQKRPLRVLGHGYSSGYHWRNPGPNSDYYNPYSAQNSVLMSQAEAYGFFPSEGQPRYSPTGEPNFETIPGQPIEGNFQESAPIDPSNNSSASEPINSDGASYYQNNNSFRPSPKVSPNDFVPASHSTPRRLIDQPDWSLDDPFSSREDPFSSPKGR